MDRPLAWAIGFFFANMKLSMHLLTVVAGGGEGHAKAVQVDGFHGKTGILRLLNCQLPL